MLFELIPAVHRLEVEGHSDASSVGPFRGVVLAIGLRGSDPVAAVTSEEAEMSEEPEGLLGWGMTYFLVADSDKPAPVWVAKGDISRHEVVDAPAGQDASAAARSGAR